MNTPDMQAKAAIKWIDGLAKTRVKQGKKRLGNASMGYCCLGYGCMQSRTEYAHEDGYSSEFRNVVGLRNSSGMDYRIPALKRNTTEDKSSLDYLNDHYSYTFKQISLRLKDKPDNCFSKKVATLITEHYKQQESA